MRAQSGHIQRWRENTKRRMVAALGGKCCICGYSKCIKSLDFHHLDPSQKERNFGSFMSNPASWDKMVVELRKCVLLCSNCHGEVHWGEATVPADAMRFDEDYAVKGEEEQDECPVCKSLKPTYFYVCSKSCAAMKAGNIDWDSIDVMGLKREGKSNTEIGNMLGVSKHAVVKRIKRLLIQQSGGQKARTSKQNRPSLEVLMKERKTKTLDELGAEYGVSGDTIRYWIKTPLEECPLV